MAMVSHLYHLFNAETCQAYIHALRWKDRPLQCPRCQSHHVGRSCPSSLRVMPSPANQVQYPHFTTV
jgi:hypothetical protein